MVKRDSIAKAEIERKQKERETIDEEKVVLMVYEAALAGYPVKFYGYINFGDGKGNIELSKAQFDEYSKKYKVRNSQNSSQ
jgi:hypothetical protein